MVHVACTPPLLTFGMWLQTNGPTTADDLRLVPQFLSISICLASTVKLVQRSTNSCVCRTQRRSIADPKRNSYTMSGDDDDELAQMRAQRAARMGTAGLTLVSLTGSRNIGTPGRL